MVGFFLGAKPFVRSQLIPNEDMKALTLYAAAHIPANDPILLAQDSNFGFAYYWPKDQPGREANSSIIQEYQAYFPDQPRIVVATNRLPSGVDLALDQALALSQKRGCTPIWLVRTHVTPMENDAFDKWLNVHHLSAEGEGPSGLTIVRLTKAVCQLP